MRDVQDIRDLAERGRHVLDGTLRCGILPSLAPTCCRWFLWLAMANGHPLAAKPVIEPEDMRGQDVLALESPHSLRDRLLALVPRPAARPVPRPAAPVRYGRGGIGERPNASASALAG